MERRFYSQNGEDRLLWEVFDGPGFFVDVGAFDGIHLSNTLSFEQQGWTGLCIEPHPAMFRLCQENRTATCIHAACVGDPSANTVVFQVEDLGLLSGITLDEKDLRSRYEGRGLPYRGTQTIEVPALTLDTLLRDVPRVDFISVDVEGTEMDVLRGLDLNVHRPRVLVVEANHPAEVQHLQRHLRRYGFMFARAVKQNLFFASTGHDRHALRRQVSCQIQANLHPLGEEYTLKETRAPREVVVPAARWPPLSRLAKMVRRISHT